MCDGYRKPTPPGQILRDEFIVEYGLTQAELASALKVERRRINEIVGGKRRLTPDTAIRLSIYFGTTVEFWLNLQAKLDLWLLYQDADKVQEYNQITRIAPP